MLDLVVLTLIALWLLGDEPYAPLVSWTAAKYGVPSGLVSAIIKVESGGRAVRRWEPKVGDWACGPMQVLLSTARWLGFRGDAELLTRPSYSIEYGTRYLRYQLERYNWDLHKAISAYNAGRYTPANWRYVERVMRAWLGRPGRFTP